MKPEERTALQKFILSVDIETDTEIAKRLWDEWHEWRKGNLGVPFSVEFMYFDAWLDREDTCQN